MNTGRVHLAEVIGKRTLGVRNLDELAKEIAAYLLIENRTAELEPLMRDIIAYRTEHGIVEATTYSAHNLDAKDIADIRAILSGEYKDAKEFILNQQLDSNAIGGVKLDLPGEQLDLTVRSKVNTFKRLTALGKE